MSMNHAIGRYVRAAIAVSLLGSAVPSLAQDGAGRSDPCASPRTRTGDKLEEVCVTSSRQGAQDIQQVPMAITAIQPESIENLGLTGLQDYTRLAPSVSMQNEGPGLNAINIRGLVTTSIDTTNVQDRSLVAIYYDDAPISLQSSTVSPSTTLNTSWGLTTMSGCPCALA